MLGASAELGDLADMMLTNAAAFADVIEAIVASPRPVVAAIDGPAVGGGASLALACDVRVATPRARLVFAWGRYGLPPDGCVTATLAAAVGPVRAQSLVADGADIGVDSDVAPLLFSRVVEVDQVEQEALAAQALAEFLAYEPTANSEPLALSHYDSTSIEILSPQNGRSRTFHKGEKS